MVFLDALQTDDDGLALDDDGLVHIDSGNADLLQSLDPLDVHESWTVVATYGISGGLLHASGEDVKSYAPILFPQIANPEELR